MSDRKTIYLIRIGDFLKIGITDNLDKRLYMYATHVPLPIEVVKTKPGTIKDERRLHERFWHLHHSREWFVYDESIVEGFDEDGFHLVPQRKPKRAFRGNDPIDVSFLYQQKSCQ